MSLQCDQCSREFSVKSNLTRHLRMVHNIEVERIDILPGDFDLYHYKCLEGCNISFKYNRELRKHLKLKHGINIVELNLEFPNSEEFNKWLHSEETNNYVQYVHLTATKRKSTGVETYYYECSRTGKRSHVDENIRKRKARKWVAKLNRGCTSQIIVNKSHDGSYSVIYYKTHYGHEIGLEHVKLSKQDRGSIASKLLLGLPISTVLHSVKNPSGAVKRINLVGRKDVFNIRKSYNIDLRDGKLANIDTININSFLQECESHQYNPILYCSLQSCPDSTDICFIIMSKYQSEILTEIGGNIIVLNSLVLKNCDFDLITLFVIGQSWETFPATCMFTNKTDSNAYELLFTKIRERVGNIAPQILITNCSDTYCQVWKSVMGEVGCHIYNPFQIEMDWKLNLNRICCSETDVTKIKRKWVYDSLKTLQSNPEEGDFLENLEATMKVLGDDGDFREFLAFFLENYSDPQKWADCYRVGLNLPIQQLLVISDVLKQYLNEEHEVRFDRIFHSLIRFIRDETVNSMLKAKNRVFFVGENDNRHHLLDDKHLNSTHLSEDLWNVTDEDFKTVYVVHKYLEKKCCNLTCTVCHICIHCFSCTCVDFFISNAICVHIHYIWVTYFQSIVKSDCDDDTDEQNCDEEIIIEVNEEPEDESGLQLLRNEIVARTAVLSANICNVENEQTLKVVLETVNQLCELVGNGNVKNELQESVFLDDHSYL